MLRRLVGSEMGFKGRFGMRDLAKGKLEGLDDLGNAGLQLRDSIDGD